MRKDRNWIKGNHSKNGQITTFASKLSSHFISKDVLYWRRSWGVTSSKCFCKQKKYYQIVYIFEGCSELKPKSVDYGKVKDKMVGICGCRNQSDLLDGELIQK